MSHNQDQLSLIGYLCRGKTIRKRSWSSRSWTASELTKFEFHIRVLTKTAWHLRTRLSPCNDRTTVPAGRLTPRKRSFNLYFRLPPSPLRLKINCAGHSLQIPTRRFYDAIRWPFPFFCKSLALPSLPLVLLYIGLRQELLSISQPLKKHSVSK